MAEYRVLVEKLTQGWVHVEAPDADVAYHMVHDGMEWDEIEAEADWGSCGDERNVYNDVEWVRETPSASDNLWN